MVPMFAAMIVETVRWRRVDDDRLAGLAEGALLRIVVKGRAIRFVRMGGVLRALADQCPHQGKSFEGGWCEDGHVVCPWHRLQFDPVTGRCRFGMAGNVEVFPLEERADGVHIGFPHTTVRIFGIDLW